MVALYSSPNNLAALTPKKPIMQVYLPCRKKNSLRLPDFHHGTRFAIPDGKLKKEAWQYLHIYIFL
jgi:hypothetical protein